MIASYCGSEAFEFGWMCNLKNDENLAKYICKNSSIGILGTMLEGQNTDGNSYLEEYAQYIPHRQQSTHVMICSKV